jgi:hypothetical protein
MLDSGKSKNATQSRHVEISSLSGRCLAADGPTLGIDFVVEECWEQEYMEAENARRDVIALIEAEGWQVSDRDDLGNFDATALPF